MARTKHAEMTDALVDLALHFETLHQLHRIDAQDATAVDDASYSNGKANAYEHALGSVQEVLRLHGSEV